MSGGRENSRAARGRFSWVAASMLVLVACGRAPEAEKSAMETSAGYAAGAPPPAPEREEAAPPAKTRAAPKPGGRAGRMDLDEVGSAEPAEEVGPSRSWFPETFLFEPIVETDATGRASVDVKVPDRLTTWRVLALAHDRGGAQAGAVTSFLGTLPVYVEPVVPRFLMVGDEIELPIQVVNTTSEAVEGSLRLRVEGAVLARGEGVLRVPAAGSAVQSALLRADRAGTARIRASFAGKDAVERTIEVRSTGRPISFAWSGTLAAPRSLEVHLPPDLEGGRARARLTILPGVLALLRSELDHAPARDGIEDAIYALRLAGRAPRLVRALGGEVDDKALRSTALVATQRVLRAARAPSPDLAALLAQASLAHPDNPILSRLGERLLAELARAQRPDGTFLGGDGWPLARVLAGTAECVDALLSAEDEKARVRAKGAALRAGAAFERSLAHLGDPYTQALVAASPAAVGSIRTRLVEKVRAAVEDGPDGTKRLRVPKGAVRPDGSAPTEVEATARAALALASDPESAALVLDLGAYLIRAYRPSAGFGDARTNLAALDALLALFSKPIAERVTVTLSSGGTEIARHVLEGDALGRNAVLNAEIAAAARTLEIRAEPAVPGLGYALELAGFVPWTGPEKSAGLELAVAYPQEMRAGEPAELEVSLAAPAGVALALSQPLPAGFQADEESLRALEREGKIAGFEVESGRVALSIAPLPPGRTFLAAYRVIPTLRGRLHSAAAELSAVGRAERTLLPPAAVTVR